MNSQRWPWLRGGLLGGVLPLLPLVWVFEISSCGGTHESERTGLSLLKDLEPIHWAVLTVVLAMSVLAPWLANRVLRPGARVAAHGAGLLVTSALSYFGWLVLFFAIFETRILRPAGGVALALLGATLVDALARFGLAVAEWRRARAQRTAGP